MKIKINRTYLPKVTIGNAQLISPFGGLLMNFKTVELPWLNNQFQISCIPVGIYEWVIYQSPKHGTVLLLLNVPNRSMIEVHIGNFTRDILGCIVVGDEHTDLDFDGIMDVKNSKTTMKKLLSLCGTKGTIEIL